MTEFNKIAVIGAAGKMGMGITLLLLIWLVDARLIAIDLKKEALESLKKYLKQQLFRYAEKNINRLRQIFANAPKLVSNEDIINAYVEQALNKVYYSSHLEDLEGSELIFEATVEDIAAKTALFERVNTINHNQGWIFTNTSSIPIALLNERAKLNNRIVGFHFYNPPPVQKLVEIIELPESPQELKAFAKELANTLQKKLVFSNDVPGFIGNGYLMREILYAFHIWDKSDLALQQIDTVTREFLLRPMGIFQLMDYVGLDVVRNILAIMQMLLPDDSFKTDEIDAWLNLGIKGGQEKSGIFEYSQGKPVAVFSLSQKKYIPLTQELNIGKPPLGLKWSQGKLQKEVIESYFKAIAKEESLGAKLAKDFLRNEKKIADFLVSSHVAGSFQDVSTVLKNGFYHLYEPRDEF